MRVSPVRVPAMVPLFGPLLGPLLGLLLVPVVLGGCDPPARGRATVASVEVVRPTAEIAAPGGRHAVAGRERLGEGDGLKVGDRAQAILRHDAGARLLLDGGAELKVSGGGGVLERGRLFADVPAGAGLELSAAGVVLSAAGAAFDLAGRDGGAFALTVVRGEVALRGGAGRGLVRAGEGAVLGAGKPGELPRAAATALWDDWTGGLGWPDPRKGRGAAGLGEVGARRPGSLGEARFPLSVQRLEVRTRVEDDLAITTVEQTFFNPADATLEGIYRVRVPEGAILSRFAIDRRGRFVDGYVKERQAAQQQYQAQVYEGSTHDPALLEWEAPGSYKARLYPLPPGERRRVLITYSEWLTPHGPGGTLRTFRYPMATPAGADAPVIQELDVEVDASAAGASELRPGLGAVVPEGERRVVLRRTDYLPTADLTVELVGPRRGEEARGYRAPHVLPARPGARAHRAEEDYVLLRAPVLPAPDGARREPLDVVLLLDLSAATDATHLAMARTVAEAVLRQLGPEDRAALLGADLDVHAIAGDGGPAGGARRRGALPPLQPVSAEGRERLLAELGRARTGGATDLGATLADAAALLQRGRPGAVIYVGDALPTVGELDLPALRERLDRQPAPLRLYGVGIGAEADLGLLEGLCRTSAGRAFRVSDRVGAAETALAVVAHLSRPAAARVTVQPGPDVDHVYPRQPVSVLAGEALTVVARVRKGIPAAITVEGVADGKPFKRSVPVRPAQVRDTADLRLRWSEARLQHLLGSGASTEEVAELGVRQNLITPYTSFYVPSEDEIGALERALPKVRAAGCARSAPEAAMEREPAAVAASAPVAREQAEAALRARMESGKMGRRDESNGARRGQHAIRGPGVAAAADAPPPPAAPPQKPAPAAQPAPAEPAPPKDEEAREVSKGDKNVAEVFDRKSALGRDDGDVLAGLVGTEVGDAYGAGGLGLVGSGAGGGTGEGTIGLGTLGTIGRGAGAKGGKKAKTAAPAKAPRRPRLEAPGSQVALVDRQSGVTVLVGIVSHRPRGCSAASGQPLDERVELWRERLSQGPGVRRAAEVWQDAERGCELPRWTDRRELLRLVLRSVAGSGGAPAMVQLYRQFDDREEEQDFLRKAILGEVRTPRDLRVIHDGLGLGDEERATLAQEVVRASKTLEERRKRLGELLARWPQDLRLRLLRMETEELLGDKEAARRTAEEVRQDPYADVQARTAVGELQLRLGDEPAARRTFSEIVEFAPRDPLARRRLGDLYRAHGWFDEAYRQYQTLLQLSPADPGVLLLQAMAATGAGHVQEALGLYERVRGTAEPGSEAGLPHTALLLGGLELALLRQDARQRGDAEELARLMLRARRGGMLQLARPVRVLLRWAHPEADLELSVAAPGEAMGPVTELAPEFGLLGWLGAKDGGADGAYQIEVRRGTDRPALRYDGELIILLNEGEKDERLLRMPVQASADRPLLRFTLQGGKVEVK